MNYDFSNLWVEKWRPKKFDDFVISEENKSIISTYKGKSEIPNLLFTGNPGIGKTSLAKIIVNDLLECQYLYINASDENGIDTIRSKVTHFAQTKSIDGKIKVIILDETDGLTVDAQRALRNTMEEFSKITRFILTANHRYRVIPPLQSRCQSFDLTPPAQSFVKRCIHVLKEEKIVISSEDKTNLLSYIQSFYPDLRKCLNELQKSCSTGKLLLTESKNNEVLTLVYQEIKKKNVVALRKALIDHESMFNNDYVSLLRNLFNHIDEIENDILFKKQALLIVSEYIYRSAFVIDQEINCYACLIALSEIKK